MITAITVRLTRFHRGLTFSMHDTDIQVEQQVAHVTTTKKTAQSDNDVEDLHMERNTQAGTVAIVDGIEIKRALRQTKMMGSQKVDARNV